MYFEISCTFKRVHMNDFIYKHLHAYTYILSYGTFSVVALQEILFEKKTSKKLTTKLALE